jgi:hypothetical protein
MASITMAMQDLTTNRLLKNPLKAEFTRIYISFYNSFTMSGNVVAYVWRCEVKTIFAMKLFKKSFTIFLFSTCCASLTGAQSANSFSSVLLCEAQGNRDNGCVYIGRPEGKK